MFSVLERHINNAGRVWIALAALALGLSILPMFVLRALTTLHCIAAAVLVVGLPRRR